MRHDSGISGTTYPKEFTLATPSFPISRRVLCATAAAANNRITGIAKKTLFKKENCMYSSFPHTNYVGSFFGWDLAEEPDSYAKKANKKGFRQKCSYNLTPGNPSHRNRAIKLI